ncbi:MAG: transporter substrate-binding domain-containing protein [Fastidiosipilaceae bacterium]|jgi:polar amino acid transport system substrate-binding protein
MKNLKKRIALIAAATLSITVLLTACGGKAKPADPSAEDSKESVTVDSEDTADESFAKVEAEGKLKMGLDDSFPPMGFRDENNEITGFDVDLATEVCARLDLELELVPIDWSMKENELTAGNIDCLWNGYSFTEERDATQTLSSPYMSNEQVLVVMKDSGLTSLDDLADKKLAIQEGSTAEQALDKAEDFKASLAQIVPFKENVTGFMDVEGGSTDVILLDSIVANYYIAQKDNSADFLILDEALASEDYVIGFRKGDVALKDKVENTLLEMKEDGKLAEISTKWFGEDITVLGK